MEDVKEVKLSKEQEAEQVLQQAYAEKRAKVQKEVNDILQKNGFGLKIVQTIEIVPING